MDDICAGCGRELPEGVERVQVREDDTGIEMTLGAFCCLGQEDGYEVI